MQSTQAGGSRGSTLCAQPSNIESNESSSGISLAVIGWGADVVIGVLSCRPAERIASWQPKDNQRSLTEGDRSRLSGNLFPLSRLRSPSVRLRWLSFGCQDAILSAGLQLNTPMTTSAPQPITASDIPEELSFDSILLGCAQSVLPRLPPACVDCIVTSPPYFGQRDYGVAGQIGTEETPEEYIERLTLIFREAKRLLKRTGSLWLNLGDKYDNLHMLGLPWRLALSLKADG